MTNANYHTIPNTLSFDAFDLGVGTVLTNTLYPNVQFVVSSKTKGTTPLSSRPVSLYHATKAVFDAEGDLTTEYRFTDLWATEDGITLTEVAQVKGLNTHKVKDKSKTKPWSDNPTYTTVYSHMPSADDVVTTDMPTAVGYKKGEATLWSDYLAGGEGALSREWKKYKKINTDEYPTTECCGVVVKGVADLLLCPGCGSEVLVNK